MQTNWFHLLWGRSQKSLKSLAPREFLSLVRPKCQQIVTDDELALLLASKKKLRVKFGIDASGADIHLGHAVPLMLLRLFQRAGHEVHFVIGDFTGTIGDPADQVGKRRDQDPDVVARFAKTYMKQTEPLLNQSRAKIHFNARWLKKVRLADFFRFIGSISFGEVSQREDFRARLKAGSPVSLREANYASLMAIDSVHIKANVEVGGIDQLLNFMQARSVMSGEGMKPEVLLATPIIEGTSGDGRKMSKSFENYIALRDSADNQFGLVMSIPDRIVVSYFTSFGDVFESEVEELDAFIREQPLEAKKQLGMLIVALIHGERAARLGRAAFERKFSKKEYNKSDEEVIETILPKPLGVAIFEAFAGSESRSSIRRLIEQGGVQRIGKDAEEKLTDPYSTIENGNIIKVGKLRIFRFQSKK